MRLAPISSCLALPVKALEVSLLGLCKLVQFTLLPLFRVLRTLGCIQPIKHAVKIPTITEFYRGGRNDRGVTLEEIWAFDDETKEAKHDFIQWLFPIKSIGMNPTAPPTSSADIQTFRSNPDLQKKMRTSFAVMLSFYGFEYGRLGTIRKANNFAQQAENWLHLGNHNHLRITRILTSLQLHGLEKEAKAFFAALEKLYREQGSNIGKETFDYWKEAIDLG